MEEIYDEIRVKIASAPENQQFTQNGWQPIFMASTKAKILIIGQAPGIVTQEKGQVFLDKSGDRLREWLGVDNETFYESGKFAVIPMDFYFPGKGTSGDLPPRKDFAAKWHQEIFDTMPDVELVILIGMYAQKYYLKDSYPTITENVLHYQEFLPQYFPIVHPSPRNQIWMSKHPELRERILPVLKEVVREIVE